MRTSHVWTLAVAAALAACASSSGRAPAVAAGVSDTTRTEPPVIQVRTFPSSATVSVLGWSVDDAAYGLRAEVKRDGALVGGNQRTGHRPYMSVEYVAAMGGFNRAAVGTVPPAAVLPVWRAGKDRNACNRSDDCAPMYTVNVQFSDALLRQHRDSMVVTFYALAGNDWTVTLRRELIDAYLRTVDSVGASFRGR